MIQTVKEQRNIDTNELLGCLVDGTKSVPLDEGNRDYQEVIEWIDQGNTPEPAYTQAELDQQVKDARISEIDARLSEIDLQSLRPLRAIANGTQTDIDIHTLNTLDEEAITLRTERATLA